MSPLDQPGRDTWLARHLHDQGALPVEVLQEQLWEARRSGRPLARVLVERGTLSEAAIRAALGPPPTVPAPTEPAGPTPSWTAGSVVGEYELLAELGSGGMGQVFRARHRPSGAIRALKTLLVGSDPEVRRRFEREGAAQAALPPHPHVARVHTAGEVAGRLYLVMELVDGEDLEARIRRAPLDPAEAATLVAALADGLQHAHDHGVLHRDLKPANVLLTTDGAPKLVDFGLARVAWEGSLTESGALMGTPAYMAPEQVESAHDVDARADVYALGAVLYACLTGRPPFAGTSVFALLNQVLTEPPVAPSGVRPGVPAWLDALCAETLAKAPDDRPASAADLAAALRAGPPAPRRAGRAAWLAAALLVGLGAALLAASSEQEPAPPPPPSAFPGPPATPPPPPEERQRAEACAAMRTGDWRALAALPDSDPWVAGLQTAGRVLRGEPAERPKGKPLVLYSAARLAAGLRRRLAQGHPEDISARQLFDDQRKAQDHLRTLSAARRDWWIWRDTSADQPALAAALEAIGARFVVTASELLVALSWHELRRAGAPSERRRDSLLAQLAALNEVAPTVDLAPYRDYFHYLFGGRQAIREATLSATPESHLLPELVPVARLVAYLHGSAQRSTRLALGERVLETGDPTHATFHGFVVFLHEHGRDVWRSAFDAWVGGAGRPLDRERVQRGHDLIKRGIAWRENTTEGPIDLTLCDLILGEVEEAQSHAAAIPHKNAAIRRLLFTEIQLANGNRSAAQRFLTAWPEGRLPPEARAQLAVRFRTWAQALQVLDAPGVETPNLHIPWRTRAYTQRVVEDGAWLPKR